MSGFPVAPAAREAARRGLADAEPRVFWTSQAGRPAIREPLTEIDRVCDLAIIGAGFTGLWAAIQAKEDDPALDVVVLDQGRVVEQGTHEQLMVAGGRYIDLVRAQESGAGVDPSSPEDADVTAPWAAEADLVAA